MDTSDHCSTRRRYTQFVEIDISFLYHHCAIVEVILYKSISELSETFRPTIAIITVNYFEKLAVDAMIENKITFIRHHKQGKTIVK